MNARRVIDNVLLPPRPSLQLPELHELLLEAGFSKVRFFWEEFEEDSDPDEEYLQGTGNYVEVTEQEQQESWIVYIVAER